MKQIVVITLLMFFTLSYAQEESTTLNWLTNLEEAEAISKQNNQPILVYFNGSDWCTPCKALKSDFFDTEEFRTRAAELVLVMIDYPRRVDIISEEQLVYNKNVMSKYNTDRSFPKLVILNNKGKELGNLSGYSSFNTYKDTSHHFAFVDKYLVKNH
ncbi:MAG: thioredoxin family protein [Bacteroidia bacterium]|nr:thioredoxin family protein [Bacteroidia bacterium]NNM23433.1 thioredoxin family protein [Flavobacteriaceae bacterium]